MCAWKKKLTLSTSPKVRFRAPYSSANEIEQLLSDNNTNTTSGSDDSANFPSVTPLGYTAGEYDNTEAATGGAYTENGKMTILYFNGRRLQFPMCLIVCSLWQFKMLNTK